MCQTSASYLQLTCSNDARSILVFSETSTPSNNILEIQTEKKRIPFPLIEWAWSPELDMKIPCEQESKNEKK